MPPTPIQLADEITNDPVAIGYKNPDTSWKDDQTIADLLNAPRVGVTFFRGVIPSYEIVDATVPAEWAALTAAEKQRYQTLTGAGQVNTKSQHVRDSFLAMFAAGTTTRANLAAMAQRQGSRAEELWDEGTVISHLDVAAARSA